MGTGPTSAGHCRSCKKLNWQSRSDAKLIAKRHYPGDNLRPYSCPTGNGMYHLGHQYGDREAADAAWVAKMRRPARPRSTGSTPSRSD